MVFVGPFDGGFPLACGLAFSTAWVAQNLAVWKQLGALIGTLVSGIFLLVMGALNLVLWIEIWQQFVRQHHGEQVSADTPMANGFLMRIFGRAFRFVNKSSHLFGVGILFGLGFDTASEVALLALSAGAVALSWTAVLALPVLFAAGMSLMDTSDGVLMNRAYRWAFATARQRVFYNLAVTGLSVVAALVIGGWELAQFASQKWGFLEPLSKLLWRHSAS